MNKHSNPSDTGQAKVQKCLVIPSCCMLVGVQAPTAHRPCPRRPESRTVSQRRATAVPRRRRATPPPHLSPAPASRRLLPCPSPRLLVLGNSELGRAEEKLGLGNGGGEDWRLVMYSAWLWPVCWTVGVFGGGLVGWAFTRRETMKHRPLN